MKVIVSIALGILLLFGGGLYLVVGPKGISRDFSAWKASAYGTDYLVVQKTFAGTHCWKIPSGSVASESGSDGIYFKDRWGNIVHVGGPYTYLQISRKDHESLDEAFNAAAKRLGVDPKICY